MSQGTVKHKIFLSGTPIKNHAVEYFPSLNLLRPDLFPDRTRFIQDHVGFYREGNKLKPAGIRYPEDFKELTKDFIIRRTRKEVELDLPEIVRDFKYYEMGQGVQKAYDKGVKRLDKFLNENSESSRTFRAELHGHMMILYHLTGLSKVEPIIEFAEEFMDGHDEGQKLAFFHHHIDVGDLLEAKFKELKIPTARIISQYNASRRVEILDKFRNDKEIRFFIGPSLACGEGIDLEFCDQGVLCEREWNPANEEQVEGRFIRATPELVAKGVKSFNMVYPVAIGTIDEFFAELVERKRQYVTETLSGKKQSPWNETEIMLEIAKRAIESAKAA